MPAAPSLVRQRVSDAISMWRGGQLPDARGFIAQHPEVRSSQSLVIDLAYEEFCLRQEAGEQLDTEKFVASFPTVQHSLARMLDVHGVMRSQEVRIDTEVNWPEAGTRWLDWDLVEPLGRGAFSRVFLAREPALGNREVVVKCSFAGPHEAFILGSLSHPNIVPIHSTRPDEARGLIGISMPLLGRSTLADALNRLAAQGIAARSSDVFWQAPIGKQRAAPAKGADYTSSVIGLMQRVSLGLAAAHAAGVVHGDIKPSNILLSFEGEPMLMDFNLSAGPDGGLERSGGTPPYMAPECLAGFWQTTVRPAAARRLDPRSDLFSLGAVLLELLLGRIPVHFDLNRPELLPTEEAWQALARDAVCDAREPKLQSVLDRCLAFNPSDRYPSAAHMAADLAGILESKERFRRWTRRLAMAAAASVVAGAGVTLWGLNQEDPNSLPALLRRAREHIDRKEFQAASFLLIQAQQQRHDPRLMAWTGYCLLELAHYESAKAFLTVALKFEDRADLRNNLGYCCAKLKHSAEAKAHFQQALTLEPGLQAAFHNRANLRRDDATRESDPLPIESWRDYQQAKMIGPCNGELSLDMAKAITYCRLRKQPTEGDLEEQIVMALAAGVGLDTFRSSRFSHEQLDLDNLANRAKDWQGPPIPRSARLILPPSLPLPAE